MLNNMHLFISYKRVFISLNLIFLLKGDFEHRIPIFVENFRNLLNPEIKCPSVIQRWVIFGFLWLTRNVLVDSWVSGAPHLIHQDVEREGPGSKRISGGGSGHLSGQTTSRVRGEVVRETLCERCCSNASVSFVYCLHFHLVSCGLLDRFNCSPRYHREVQQGVTKNSLFYYKACLLLIVSVRTDRRGWEGGELSEEFESLFKRFQPKLTRTSIH